MPLRTKTAVFFSKRSFVLFFQKLLYNCLFATVRELTEMPDMLVLVLPTLISLINHSNEEDYRTMLQPELHKVIAMTRPVQVSLEL